MSSNDLEIFNEILASDKLGAWQGYGQTLTSHFGEDPSILWENIKWNPWVAMSIFEDMEDKDNGGLSYTRGNRFLERYWNSF